MAEKYIKQYYRDTVDPSFTDDVNDDYQVGDEWLNTAASRTWMCIDNSAGAAQWVRTSAEGRLVSQSTADTTVGGAVVNTWYVPDPSFTLNLPITGIWDLYLRSRIFIDWSRNAAALEGANLILALGQNSTPGVSIPWAHQFGSSNVSNAAAGDRRILEERFDGYCGRFDLVTSNLYIHIFVRPLIGTVTINTLTLAHSLFLALSDPGEIGAELVRPN